MRAVPADVAAVGLAARWLGTLWAGAPANYSRRSPRRRLRVMRDACLTALIQYLVEQNDSSDVHDRWWRVRYE